jgi:drug/metabolite transporter (DMT)-like permease
MMEADPTLAHAVRRKATLIGLSAVLMWATLGVFTAMTASVDASGRVSAIPPFQLNALCFGLAGTLAMLVLWARGRLPEVGRASFPALTLMVGGLFGYHALYFTALRNAPAIDANLINYLWPLLIVLLSGLLPGQRLAWYHGAGALLGFAGAALLILGKGGGLDPAYLSGYGAALGAAFVWAGYSVLSRLFADVPTGAVAGACLLTCLFSLVAHLLLETTVWPQGPAAWLGIVGLGLFPVGAAFFVWDIGMKRGDMQVLGAAAYGAPLLSTLLLLAFGFGAFSWPVAGACLLITLGALLAARDMILRRR